MSITPSPISGTPDPAALPPALPLGFRRNMVQARRAGRKDVTRRLCRGQFTNSEFRIPNLEECPHGQPGQPLYVKEDFQFQAIPGVPQPTAAFEVRYLADQHLAMVNLTEHEQELLFARKHPYAQTPGRFMYRSLARDKPTLLSVRVERLLDIDDADAVREGIEPVGTGYRSYLRPDSDIQLTPRASFLELFESIHGPEVVAANPWLWRLELTPFQSAAGVPPAVPTA